MHLLIFFVFPIGDRLFSSDRRGNLRKHTRTVPSPFADWAVCEKRELWYVKITPLLGPSSARHFVAILRLRVTLSASFFDRLFQSNALIPPL